MNDEEPRLMSASERRATARRSLPGRIRVHLAPQELEGQGDDLSPNGLLLHVHAELAVEIEYELDGVIQRRKGTLARCDRLHNDRSVWAVEFERE